jgi:outer membrane protein TolC
MDPATPLELAEPLNFHPLQPPEIETLAPAALLARADYLSLLSQREALVEQQSANRARALPRLSVNGNFGEIGRNIGSVTSTGLLQGQIDFTLFDRDRNGEAQELASRVKRIDDQIADLRRGIDEELREALLNLDSAAAQVSVAREGTELAQRELQMAQDRFTQGTANNVEVITRRTNWRAPRRITFLPSAATWTLSLRSHAPWEIRRKTSCGSWEIHRRFSRIVLYQGTTLVVPNEAGIQRDLAPEV